MAHEAFFADLRTKTPALFLENYLFDRVPSLFQDDRSLYVTWKRELAKRVDVDPACVMLVGTAATGVSLNPIKGFKHFDEQSDVDVAVISSYHFNEAWRFLRLNGARRLTVDPRTKNAWDEHVKKYIYWGTIATDRLLGILPFGLKWLKAISELALMKPTEGRDINLRIYADFDSLRFYQTNSVRAARESIGSN
ncbi:MAG: hypothetical protein HGB26_06005 [Desulfobulbaceae bacterium]|nr:hypothetical protein [Desulfobulbaceae bacterium]